MNRGDVTNEQWERLQPLLPPPKPHIGRPSHDHRTILNGILWLLRTGAPWRDLPERYGPWRTVASRFYRWRRAGLFPRLWETVPQQAEAAGRLDWTIHVGDRTSIRAPQQAAGAKKGPQQSKREDAAQGASAPTSMGGPKATVSRSPSCSRLGSSTRRHA
jgi:transposase